MNYSFDANELITELEEDINLFGNDLIVWAYWIVMSNCQELYVDYYFFDGDELEDFDKKMSEEYEEFFRKKMLAIDLLDKVKSENELL